jgi:hypothetical protein
MSDDGKALWKLAGVVLLVVFICVSAPPLIVGAPQRNYKYSSLIEQGQWRTLHLAKWLGVHGW